jgi:hypothetical protein
LHSKTAGWPHGREAFLDACDELVDAVTTIRGHDTGTASRERAEWEK